MQQLKHELGFKWITSLSSSYRTFCVSTEKGFTVLDVNTRCLKQVMVTISCHINTFHFLWCILKLNYSQQGTNKTIYIYFGSFFQSFLIPPSPDFQLSWVCSWEYECIQVIFHLKKKKSRFLLLGLFPLWYYLHDNMKEKKFYII